MKEFRLRASEIWGVAPPKIKWISLCQNMEVKDMFIHSISYIPYININVILEYPAP
jgi:hypothetical protein